MKLDVEKVMSRVRAEVAKRSNDQATVEFSPPGTIAMGAAWTGALPPLPRKAAYALSDLLAYSDRAFIENAYDAVLRRRPDAAGLGSHLEMLRTGAVSKVELLAALRWSPEGIARGVHVDGLLAPFLIQKWSRKRILGPLIGWLHALLRLRQLADRPALIEAAQARETTELAFHVETVLHQVELRNGRVESLLSDVQEQLHRHVAQLHEQVSELLGKVASLEANALAETQRDTERAELQQAQIDELRQLVAAQAARFADAEQVRLASVEAEHALDPMYVAFERRFRGSPELIRERLVPYLELLRDAQVGTSDKPVLDVGCGNGEWLELLREHGFSARGVDTNRVFVDLCRGRGLEVEAADALELLRAMPDGSLGAITAMHVAEHLPFEALIALLDQCKRVLCIGGLLALETPNPENLLTASHYFYMDPTHRNPLPPESLRWLVEARGFQLSRVERWTIAREVSAPPLLAEDIPGASSVNALLSHLHAAPDYAVIARRL